MFPDYFDDAVGAWIGQKPTCGFLDRKDHVVIRTRLGPMNHINPFCEGMAAFTLSQVKGGYLDEQKSGFLNRAGKIAIAPRFDSVGNFRLPDTTHAMTDNTVACNSW